MLKSITVYLFDDNGVFVGTELAFESWNLDGTYMVPIYATEIAPPEEIPSGHFSKWNGSEWNLEVIPPEPEPTPEPTPEPIPEPDPITWDKIRSQRNYLLSQTDWIFAPDVNIINKDQWLSYRQELRDIPQTFSNPEDVVWPTKP
jgi:hypothetical protein